MLLLEQSDAMHDWKLWKIYGIYTRLIWESEREKDESREGLESQHRQQWEDGILIAKQHPCIFSLSLSLSLVAIFQERGETSLRMREREKKTRRG